jgi:tetratricopeptide (TPR) repeat protein
MKNQNEFKKMYRIFAILSFLLAMIVYTLTAQDSVPFWDCSEFSAASILQQVPHPPGAPLFLMIGKVFDVIIPFGDPGWKINMLSATSSAFVILMLFVITTKVIRNIAGGFPKTMSEALAVYGSSFIGAAAFTFSDTFWFNAVESEVYALSTVFVALMIYLIMKWNEEADTPGHEKYLLLIAYVVGLSTGVHLLAVLTIPSIVYIVYFRKYNFNIKGFAVASVVAGISLYIIYPVVVKWIPALLAGHSISRNEAREYATSDSMFLTILPIIAIIGATIGLWWSMKERRRVISLVCTAFLLIIMGYTTYTQILIRSNVNPPMNENEPKDFKALASYLGREQYGDSPSWPRRYQEEDRFVKRYLQKNSSGQFVYGPWYRPEIKQVQTSDGQVVQKREFTRVDFWGEMMYMLKFQINHMYIRYFMWNFSGRASDEQDADWVHFQSSDSYDNLNYKNGYKDQYPIRFFFIPVIFGLIGFLYHARADKKMFWAFLVMFLLLGVLAALAQAQQDPQPRERDYFYIGSFMIWGMWIGMGVYKLILDIAKNFNKGLVAIILLASFIIVPFNMAYSGWFTHDRKGNFLPFDYSYNILQSAEKDAIVFTNGDNDTFPVWYIQDIMGVRRDVRIVNLSLGNTLWYVHQLKNRKPWGANKIPLSFSNDSLEVDEYSNRALSFDFGPKKRIRIPVKEEILRQYTDDESYIKRGMFETEVSGRPMGERQGVEMQLYRIQDKVIFDILQETKFERPVYFSTTVGPDAFAGLLRYFRYEGLLMRVCPVPIDGDPIKSINTEVSYQCLMNIDNSNDYHKEPHYGFKMRNLTNKDVYYDPVSRRLMMSYREQYTELARHLNAKGEKDRAIEVMNKMNELISAELFPLFYQDEFDFARLYKEIGDTTKANEFQESALQSCLDIINSDNIMPEIKRYEVENLGLGPHRLATRIYEDRKDFDGAIDVTQKFLQYIQEIRVVSDQANMELQQNLFNNEIYSQIQLSSYEIDKLIVVKDFDNARKIAEGFLQEFGQRDDEASRFMANEIYKKYVEIERLAMEDTSATAEELP